MGNMMLCIVSWRKKEGVNISQDDIEKIKKEHNIPIHPVVDLDQYNFLLEKEFFGVNYSCIVALLYYYPLQVDKAVNLWKLFSFDIHVLLASKGIHHVRVHIRENDDFNYPSKTREWNFGKEVI